ncbi:MAG: hypothetical protein AB1510_13275 [Bacillota bacterium]
MNHKQRYRYLRTVKGYTSDRYFKEIKEKNAVVAEMQQQQIRLLNLAESLANLAGALEHLNRRLKQLRWYL